jgi:hypothetical protein
MMENHGKINDYTTIGVKIKWHKWGSDLRLMK